MSDTDRAFQPSGQPSFRYYPMTLWLEFLGHYLRPMIVSICPIQSERVSSDLTFHQQRGHTETGTQFKVSSERPEKRGVDLAIPGLVV